LKKVKSLKPFIENMQVMTIIIKSIFQKYVKKNPDRVLS